MPQVQCVNHPPYQQDHILSHGELCLNPSVFSVCFVSLDILQTKPQGYVLQNDPTTNNDPNPYSTCGDMDALAQLRADMVLKSQKCVAEVVIIAHTKKHTTS